MKKKLLMPLLGFSTLATTAIPLASCSQTKDKDPSVSNFETDSWSTVCYYCNQGLDKLKEVYKKDTFVGLERKLTMNKQTYTVRVIGENHDTISNSTKKAALTFELNEVFCDEQGKAIETVWSSAENNYNYLISEMFKKLNDSNDVDWWTVDEFQQPVKSTYKKSCLTALTESEPELMSNIKPVLKEINVNLKEAIGGDNYNIAQYTTKLFALTYNEMIESAGTYKPEGQKYSYWQTHKTSDDRLKSEIYHKEGAKPSHKDYVLCSPTLSARCDQYHVRGLTGGMPTSMSILTGESQPTFNISFAFCL